jgi:hypothetical protein
LALGAFDAERMQEEGRRDNLPVSVGIINLWRIIAL